MDKAEQLRQAALDYHRADPPGKIRVAPTKALVTQREVGLDTLSYDEALRHAMREAPDVIMIGEIRDRLTLQHALHYAESGHLCVSTLHASNANQAVQRILKDLHDAGYLSHTRHGRQNRYQIRADAPMRHPLQQGRLLRELLDRFA